MFVTIDIPTMKKPTFRVRTSPAKNPAAPKTVDEYLAAVPEPARSTLTKVRGIIQETANRAAAHSTPSRLRGQSLRAGSEVVEVLSYGIPAVKIETSGYKGIVMWYAAFSDHCSLFPTASVIQAFKKELKDFRVSKGTVKFSVDKPLPAALLKKMVQARLAEMKGKKTEGKKRRG
jgi:uncharacterized protein YdhG (YjbR/CyaY superfamily)